MEVFIDKEHDEVVRVYQQSALDLDTMTHAFANSEIHNWWTDMIRQNSLSRTEIVFLEEFVRNESYTERNFSIPACDVTGAL